MGGIAAAPDLAWIDRWLDAVAASAATMSQRALTSIARRGGLDTAIAAARARGLHLFQLTDDGGRAIVAASRTPFRTLC